jgi:hypothetical protein
VSIRLVDPTFKPDVKPFVPAARPHSLKGKVVGLLGNGKPNSPVFLQFVGEALTQRYPVKEVAAFQKELTTMPAPADVLEEVVSKSDLVITGVGD